MAGSLPAVAFLFLLSSIPASVLAADAALVMAGSAPDQAAFPTFLENHLSLPDSIRMAIRNEAAGGLEGVARFRYEARTLADSGRRHWFYRDTEIDYSTGGVGLGNSITALAKATQLDPSFAEAWAELGHLAAGAGDLTEARRALDCARLAALAREGTDDPLDPGVWRELLRDRAWVLRDLGLWDEGLEAVQEGLQRLRGDRDLVLIKGLLLAGAGKYSEATSLAVRMPAFTFPELDVYHYGTREQTSDYANRWIRSQALLAVGDYGTARHVLGGMESLPYRWYLPHQKRFWADVGVAAELADDSEAGVYYALGLVGDEFRGFYRLSANNRLPLVLDVPDPQIPYFTSFGDRFLAAGSILSYAAGQMTRANLTSIAAERTAAAGRAKLALDIAERRNIRPDVVRAMRGRLHLSQDEPAAARRDLVAAHTAFTAAGVVDAGTSLLLGLLAMQRGEFAPAVSLLEESVEADDSDGSAWRSLGVSLARVGRLEEAAVAMDRALVLEPWSTAGLYNRGLLRLQQKDFLHAGADLEKVLQHDPENREAQRLLQMAAAGLRAEGGDPGLIHTLATAPDTTGAPVLSAAEMMATLADDVQAFFSVPDSLRGAVAADDSVITDLRARYAASRDPGLRAVLALACLDRDLPAEAQALLAPGWGVDLSPEEEVMLLRADRILGESARAESLAKRLASGEEVPTNAYILFALIEMSRENWEQRLATAHYMEGYSAALMMTMPDHARFSRYMRHGFRNLRGNASDQEGVPLNPLYRPFFRALNGDDGVGSSRSGNAAVSTKQAGAVRK